MPIHVVRPSLVATALDRALSLLVLAHLVDWSPSGDDLMIIIYCFLIFSHQKREIKVNRFEPQPMSGPQGR